MSSFSLKYIYHLYYWTLYKLSINTLYFFFPIFASCFLSHWFLAFTLDGFTSGAPPPGGARNPLCWGCLRCNLLPHAVYVYVAAKFWQTHGHIIDHWPCYTWPGQQEEVRSPPCSEHVTCKACSKKTSFSLSVQPSELPSGLRRGTDSKAGCPISTVII